MTNLIFQSWVVVNFPRNITFITVDYCHLLFIPMKYFSVFLSAQIAPTCSSVRPFLLILNILKLVHFLKMRSICLIVNTDGSNCTVYFLKMMWIAKTQVWKKIFPNFTLCSLCVSFLSRAKTNSTNWHAPNVWGKVFVAQLVEHCGANTEAMGSNPVEVPISG